MYKHVKSSPKISRLNMSIIPKFFPDPPTVCPFPSLLASFPNSHPRQSLTCCNYRIVYYFWILQTWNQTWYSGFCLSSFTRHSYFHIHPYCFSYQCRIQLLSQFIFKWHCNSLCIRIWWQYTSIFPFLASSYPCNTDDSSIYMNSTQHPNYSLKKILNFTFGCT
jgi:hypothetical protein